MAARISFVLNGKPVSVETDERRMLVDVLRSNFGLTGTKIGCRAGLCGACTVVIGDRAVRACTTSLKAVQGRQVLTIEGLNRAQTLSDIQRAFVDENAFQCGFCTPGMIMSAYALLKRNPRPTRAQIIDALEDNLCRCGTHPRVIRAVEATAQRAKAAATAGKEVAA